MPMRRRVACIALVGLVLLVVAAPAAHAWRPRVNLAIDYANQRRGVVRFAVIGPRGRLYPHNAYRTAPAASVIKVMFMVAYLRRPSVRDRALNENDRELLRPMIVRSDNDAATTIANRLGPRPINRLARDAEMRNFSYTRPWGLSRINSRDQARFMFRLERCIPGRHERYARYLLSHIVRPQRWGIARVDVDDWRLFFKSGWGSGTGRVDHQVAFIENGDSRIAVAVLTEYSPSHRYGKRTLRGVTARLLRRLPEEPATRRALAL